MLGGRCSEGIDIIGASGMLPLLVTLIDVALWQILGAIEVCMLRVGAISEFGLSPSMGPGGSMPTGAAEYAIRE